MLYQSVSFSLLCGTLLMALLALANSSCSRTDATDREPVFPVRGKVLVQGQPADNALVIFHPQESSDAEMIRPNGRAQADGSFTVGTYETGDGAPAGEYLVTITWPEPVTGNQDPDLAPDRLQGRYADPVRSKLRAKVGPEENVLQAFEIQ
jgi:hypothetical protein